MPRRRLRRARRSRRSGKLKAGFVLLVLVAAGVGALIHWFVDLPAASQDLVTLGAVATLALIGHFPLAAWRRSRRKRREYRRALLDFRWREDMSPIEFEQRCADYLALKGWKAKTTKRSGDQGADVVARKGAHLLVVQCKKYQKPVGNKAVQEVIAARAYRRATAAAVVSNQGYTPAARELATKTDVLLLHFTELRDVDRLLGSVQHPSEGTRE